MTPDLERATECLQKLAVELEERRFAVRLCTGPGRPPRLRVINPLAPVLTENVLAAPGRDGRWGYWFSWPQHIALADDIVAAADRIECVLAEVDR